jgi:hypothetical protein
MSGVAHVSRSDLSTIYMTQAEAAAYVESRLANRAAHENDDRLLSWQFALREELAKMLKDCRPRKTVLKLDTFTPRQLDEVYSEFQQKHQAELVSLGWTSCPQCDRILVQPRDPTKHGAKKEIKIPKWYMMHPHGLEELQPVQEDVAWGLAPTSSAPAAAAPACVPVGASAPLNPSALPFAPAAQRVVPPTFSALARQGLAAPTQSGDGVADGTSEAGQTEASYFTSRWLPEGILQ